MIQIDFQPVFDYIDKQTALLREELPSKEDFRQLQSSVDGIAKHLVDNKTETAAMRGKTDRMEGWIIKAAPKVDIPYEK